jgi:hypothetical protein
MQQHGMGQGISSMPLMGEVSYGMAIAWIVSGVAVVSALVVEEVLIVGSLMIA